VLARPAAWEGVIRSRNVHKNVSSLFICVSRILDLTLYFTSPPMTQRTTTRYGNKIHLNPNCLQLFGRANYTYC